MPTTRLSVAALVVLTLGIAAFSHGPARAATGLQPGCTQEDALITRWIQAQLNGEWEVNREILGLTHLKNEPVRALGGQAGDDEICDQLFQRLHEQYRAELASPEPEAEVYYFHVGDRYLVYVGTALPTFPLWSVVVSFDLEYNQIKAATW